MTKLRAVIRRRWPVLVAGLVLGALAGVFSSMLAPEDDERQANYSATQVLVANRNAAQQGNVEQDALRVTRGEVAQRAAQRLEADPQRVARRVSATPDKDSRSIEVTSTDQDPDAARERVAAFADSFLEVVNADLLADQERRFASLRQQIDEARAQLEFFDAANPDLSPANPFLDQLNRQLLLQERASLEQNLVSAQEQLRSEELNAQQALPYTSLGQEAPQEVNDDLLPVPDNMAFRGGLLGLFGLVLSVGLVMLVERLNPRIDTREELVATVELPVLAEVGHFSSRKLPRSSNGTVHLEGAWSEPYRRIRSAIQFVQSTAPADEPTPRAFMFASPSPSAGKSTSTAVTGLAMAEAGQRTLVLGGDFRRPSVHALLGVPTRPGVRERAVLDVDRPSIEDVVHPTSHDELFVTPSGEPGREVVGMAAAAREIVTEAVAHDATVLVDTSPVEVANDAIDLLPVVDEVIVVVRSGLTTRKALLHTLDQLTQHGAHLMGTVLIGTPGMARAQYYYEGYYSATGDGPAGGAGASAWVSDPSPSDDGDGGGGGGGDSAAAPPSNGSNGSNGRGDDGDDADDDAGSVTEGAPDPVGSTRGTMRWPRRAADPTR